MYSFLKIFYTIDNENKADKIYINLSNNTGINTPWFAVRRLIMETRKIKRLTILIL